jgi:hypothetical protein
MTAKSLPVRKVYFSESHAKKLGWIAGGLIPCLIFITKVLVLYAGYTAYFKIPLCILIVGGLVYSAPTVQSLVAGMLSGNAARYKAWGFTILLEGGLVFTPLAMINWWVASLQFAASGSALAFLVACNGYCMAELAVNRFVRPSERSSKKTTKTTNYPKLKKVA